VAAGDVERDHDAIAGLDVGDLRPDRFDDAHRLVPKHITSGQVRPEHAIQV
jgi:hypothetical protein